MVISLYTEKCKYNCAFCDIASHSSSGHVTGSDINSQMDFVIDSYYNQLNQIEQVSIGNEGSILDGVTLPLESLYYILDKLSWFEKLQVLSLETRPEYLNDAILQDIIDRTDIPVVDVTVGFETQNDQIRNGQLHKGISRELFEEKAAVLGKLGIRLTAYVMLKPGFDMTEKEGVEEACATLHYLYRLCKKCKTNLIVYLNPTYIAKNSRLKDCMEKSHYMPPKIQSVLKVLLEAEKLNIPIYTGLSSESLCMENGDFKAHLDFDMNIFNAVRQFNKNQDYAVLHNFII